MGKTMKFIDFYKNNIIQHELINKYNIVTKKSSLFINCKCIVSIRLPFFNHKNLLSLILSLELLLKSKFYYKLVYSEGKFILLNIILEKKKLFFFFLWFNRNKKKIVNILLIMTICYLKNRLKN